MPRKHLYIFADFVAQQQQQLPTHSLYRDALKEQIQHQLRALRVQQLQERQELHDLQRQALEEQLAACGSIA